MYGEQPNVQEVMAAYSAYFATYPFEKTIHTQYYKRWLSSVRGKTDESGNIQEMSPEQRQLLEEERRTLPALRGDGVWSYEGPEVHLDADGSLTPISDHSNVYAFDRAATNSQLLYCGTESGGLYKTTDGGAHWEFMTKDLLVTSVSAVRIHPSNPDIAVFSAANDLYRTQNGGASWEVIGQPSFVSQNISAWEIHFHPITPAILFAATNLGLFRSTDGGDNWTEILTNETMTVAFQPNNPSVVYAIQFEPSLGYSRFYKSTDGGVNFSLRETGWYTEQLGFTQVNNEGGRLAISQADPNRIYAMLLGYGTYAQDVETNGWIGIWVSYDAGETWEFPHGEIGTPYTESHPNLMNFSADDGTYTQIYYNSTIAASHLDANKVLIGGLNLWRSDDACASYNGVAGYIGGLARFHVDQQEIRIFKTSPTTEEVWISNDGGINYSDDFMESHSSRCRGIMAVNLWGYDQGWSEDIMVGGRYHNGNMAYHELYPAGDFLSLGGGEAPTGYVNYSDERKTYFSDLGGRVLPEAMDETVEGFGVNLWPNESYWFNTSSRILFDRMYYNVAWLGRDNSLHRSSNGGGSFGLHHTFGTNPDHQVLWMEQSYADPNVIVVHQRLTAGSKLWRTADGGTTWSEIILPVTSGNLFFDLSATNPEEMWVGFPYSSSGKIWYTTTAGAGWTNLTTPALAGEEVWGVAHQYGTDGGVYLALLRGRVVYRNNALSEWQEYSTGLPASSEPLRIIPFYKGEKIRLATWNLGVWEAPFFEPPEVLADFQSAEGTFFCMGDPVHFVDHSVVGEGAEYQWSFPGAEPLSSDVQHPTVVYTEPGTYDVTLSVTWNGQTASRTKQAYIASAEASIAILQEDFESGNIPSEWRSAHSTGGADNWAITSEASGFGEGEYAMLFDNYWIDVQGNRDEVLTNRTLVNAGLANWFITFDVAYAEYGFPYSDTLAVLMSTDCGETWEELYVKGGNDLQTAPDNTEPFTPASAEWRTEEVSLPFGDTTPEFIIAFQNRGRWGNRIYVDNVNLDFIASTNVRGEVSFRAFPNPSNERIQLALAGSASGVTQLEILDATGRIIERGSFTGQSHSMDVSEWADGVYMIRLVGENWSAVQRVVKR